MVLLSFQELGTTCRDEHDRDIHNYGSVKIHGFAVSTVTSMGRPKQCRAHSGRFPANFTDFVSTTCCCYQAKHGSARIVLRMVNGIIGRALSSSATPGT
jgi:hypothetical protein